jgi:DNA polymerase elongation subunit (family B)
MNSKGKKEAVKKFKRLFYDIETSYNIVKSWRIGYEVRLTDKDIIQERAIICVAYKWDGDSQVKYLAWNKGDDSELVTKFAEILNSADEVIGHNSDRFDTKWLRTRCLYHGVALTPFIQSIDTLKEAKKLFLFNSNKLDYISKFLGSEGKMETGGLELWDDVVLRHNKQALNKMVAYCKQDVEVLEEVFNKLNPYLKNKVTKTIKIEGNGINCVECSSQNIVKHKIRISIAGRQTQQYQCKTCGKYHSVAIKKDSKNN